MDRDDKQDDGQDVNQNTVPTEQGTIQKAEQSEAQLSAASDQVAASLEENVAVDAMSFDVSSHSPEKTTGASVSDEPIPATSVGATDSSGQSGETNSSAAVPTAVPVSGLKVKDKKRLTTMVAVGILLLVLAGALTWWLLFNSKETSVGNISDTSSSTIEQARLGIAITIIDGVVELSEDGEIWQAATADSQLKEGDFVRTNPDSRVVLTLDDGSAVRLDADTTIKLDSLLANAVEVEQLHGAVYSRLVPSDRSFVVHVDGTTYKALGTAFLTFKNTSNSGIQVFQSSVESSELDEAIPEGKQYLKPFGDFIGEITVLDIDIDAASGDSFLNWNLALDESDAKFKEKLGVLEKVKLRKEEKRRELEAAKTNSRAEVDRILEERLLAEKREKESTTKERVTRGVMTLSRDGDILHWNYTGKAVHGYKLVYSAITDEPTVGTHDSIYFGSINDNSGSLPNKEKIGDGKYFVRVCAYTAGTETENCVDYSSAVVIKL